jgi:dienelactone hydrolase
MTRQAAGVRRAKARRAPGAGARQRWAAGAAALLLLLATALSGCGDDAAPGPATTAAPAAARPAPASVSGRRVTFRAGDGRRVRGVLRLAPAPARPAPAVLLLHQVDGGAEQWDAFAPYLHGAGFTTLAFDGRGGLDVERLAREARGGLRFLRARRDVRRDRVSVVGASIGGATAIWLSSQLPHRQVAATVALSPALDATLLDLQARGAYRAHDLLLAANAQESYGFPDLRHGARRTRTLVDRDGGHGVELLTASRVRAAVIGWLRR